MKQKYRPPDVPPTEFLRRAHAFAEFELRAPQILRDNREALLDAFNEEYDEYREKIFPVPPFNVRIMRYKWRFEGGGVKERTFDEAWVSHDRVCARSKRLREFPSFDN